MGWSAIAWLGVGAVVGIAMQKLTAPKTKLVEQPTQPRPSPPPAAEPSAMDTESSAVDIEQWQLACRLAAEMAQLKGGFLARTSHELRSPLNSVISLHQLILSDLCDSPEEEREFVAQSYDAAQKLLKLLDQLTDLSKLEHGGASLAITPIDLNVLLLEVEQVVQMQAQNRNLRLEIAHPEDDIQVKGDRQRFLQVIIHLLTAPIALMDNGYIWLTTRVDGQQVAIQITDQRPADAWAEPQELLAQSREADKGEPQGKAIPPAAPGLSVGLTLILCQRLMVLMGGELRLVEASTAPQAGAAPPAAYGLECRLPLVT
ncbi:MAG: HAMP domain-containing sensor histidine kinase [Cyanobacteria bacterium P01_A01_bin.135]